MKSLISIIVLLSFITSCGHLVNPAPPKVELTSIKDQSYSCEEINAEIVDLQTKRVNTQKQLDNQKAQNILSGIGGWLVIVPFVFIDVTTDKNAAYNSYAEREKYLRKLATDKNCTNLPKPYEFPTQQKQTTFVPSGGNVVQSRPGPKESAARVANLTVPKANPSEPWTGKWSVDGSMYAAGLWAFKQDGQTVVSTDESFFRIDGKVTGNRLEGTYSSSSQRAGYKFNFVISSDCLSFGGYTTDQNGTKLVRGKRAD